MQSSLLRMAMANQNKFYMEINFGSVRGISTTINRFNNDEKPFSKSRAYHGRDRILDPSLAIPVYLPSYYDSKRFRRIQRASHFISFLALFAYIGYFREERDTDELLNFDPQLIAMLQKKQKLKAMKESWISMGKDTREIDMEMLEIMAKEAEIKAKLKKKNLNASPDRKE